MMWPFLFSLALSLVCFAAGFLTGKRAERSASESHIDGMVEALKRERDTSLRERASACRERDTANENARYMTIRAETVVAHAMDTMAEARKAIASAAELSQTAARALFGDQNAELPEPGPSVRDADAAAARRLREQREAPR